MDSYKPLYDKLMSKSKHLKLIDLSDAEFDKQFKHD